MWYLSNAVALLLFLTFAVQSTFAVSVTILSAPSSAGEDKFNVTVKTEGASAGTNYLRVDLYTEGTTQYFGETDNGQVWYSGSDGKQYFPITIVSGTPNIATVSARIGDPSQNDYPGPGNYKLRIRRYTSSGGQGSEDPQPVTIALGKTWPSPTATPTTIPTPTQSSAASPTSTATPTATPTLKPTVKPSPSPRLSLSPAPDGTVAGATTEIDLSGFGIVSPKPSGQDGSSTSPSSLTLNKSRAKTALLIGAGLILVSLASFFGYRRYLQSKTDSLL